VRDRTGQDAVRGRTGQDAESLDKSRSVWVREDSWRGRENSQWANALL